MAAKLGVLVIHGVGSQKKSFARPMIEEFERRISSHREIRWQPIWWAPILSKREKTLCDDLLLGIDENIIDRKLREFVVNFLGDATAYQPVRHKSNTTYDKIHVRVHHSIVELKKKLGNEDKPVIVIAHSLGSVIISNYIWDRQKKQHLDPYGATPFERLETLAGIITFGSPIPIFTLAYKKKDVKSIKFPPDALPSNLKSNAKWLNFFDVDDVLGWPLKHLSKSYKFRVSKDNKINVGGIFTSWNPLCHFKYWTDDDFTKPVAQYISDILKVCP